MAGKSTVLRTTATVALLAAAGLHAPAQAASFPYLDAFMLRSFSADSPLEGRSSFAVEMTEIRCVPAASRICAVQLLAVIAKHATATQGDRDAERQTSDLSARQQ